MLSYAKILLALVLVMGYLGAHAADSLCGVEFDAKGFGFEVQAAQADEEHCCGRFLVGKWADARREPVVASIAVLAGPAAESLRTNPSNFAPTKNGTLKFKRTKRVDDHKAFYFVRPLGVLSEKKLSTPTGDIYLAEYKRRVVRLKKASDQEEDEVEELQRCVEAVTTDATTTVVVAGCDLAEHGAELSVRTLDLLKAAELPLTPPAERPSK